MQASDDHQWSDTAVDDAVLVTDELVVNVEQHAGGWFTVDLVPVAGPVAVGVTDGRADRIAAPRTAVPSSPGGTGLKVVERLVLARGQLVRPSPKAIWALLPLRAEVIRALRTH